MNQGDHRVDATDLLLGLVPAEDEPRRLPHVEPRPVPLPAPEVPSPGGMDGKDVENSVGGYLDYLSQLCRQLGVADPVEEYFTPVVGRWSAMHAEAERWRAAGKAAEEVNKSLAEPLGGLDAAWEGATADSFVEYMQTVGLAGSDLSEAMTSIATVLDKTADGIREIVTEMAGVLADTAESSSQSMAGPVAGEERTRQHLDAVRRPTQEFFESVRQVLEAFVELCDGVDGSAVFDQIKMGHTFPADNWAANIDVPAAQPAPGAGSSQPAGTAKPGGGSVAGGSVGGGSVGGGGGSVGGGSVGGGGGGAAAAAPGPGSYTTAGEMPGMPAPGVPAAGVPAAGAAAAAGGGMGGMMMPPMGAGAAGGGENEHSNKSRLVGDPYDIFGDPGDSSPSVIGEDD